MAPTGIATFAKTNLCFDLDEMAVDIAIIGAPGDLTGTFNNIEAATNNEDSRKKGISDNFWRRSFNNLPCYKRIR